MNLLSLVVLISLYASGVVSSKCAESDCPLFADGVTEWELTLFPVPTNCSQYIMCQRGYKHYRPCPQGLHFNSVLDVCDWPRDAKCTECVEEIVETCDEPEECPTIEDGVTEWELTLLPVPANCSQFIMCQRGYRHLMDCPSTLHFNPILDVCDYPENAGCIGCGTPGTDIPTTETPPTKEPPTEEPTTEVPTTEVPTTEEPTKPTKPTKPPTKEPPTKEPPTKEPPTKEPPTEEPITEEPITEEPTTEAPATCEVSCGGGDTTSTFNIGNPLDCTRYYMCFNNRPISMACPKGLNFDTKHKICKLPKHANCASCEAEITDAPTTEAATTTTEATTTTTTTEATTTTTGDSTTTTEATPTTEAPEDKCATPACPANKALVLLPVPLKCNKFVTCIHGHGKILECPFGLNFDLDDKYCKLPKYARCANCGRCETPKCPANKPLAILPVPSNCNKFLTCIFGRGTEVTCPQGLFFDTATKTCTISILAKCESC